MQEHGLSIQRSCCLAGLSRTAFYRVPRSAAERDASVIAALNRQVEKRRGLAAALRGIRAMNFNAGVAAYIDRALAEHGTP